MPELETTTLPPLDSSYNEDDSGSGDAPWGYKADGTPRAKPGRKAGSSSGSSTSSRTGNRTASDERLAESIANELVELSAPIGLASPMAMLHVERRADRTGKALVSISKKHPRVKHAIQAYFDSVAYKDIALFVTGIPVAFMMDFGILKPDSKVGIPWRMEEIWHECYDEEGSELKPEAAPARGLAAMV